MTLDLRRRPSGLRSPQHVVHREPAVPALDPARGGERAARERAAIARRMGQRNRFRRSVETDRVRARDEAGARRRRRRSAGRSPPLPSPASASSAVPDGASFFMRVMRFVQPGAERLGWPRTAAPPRRRSPRTARRRSKNSARRRCRCPASATACAQRRLVRLPAGGAEDDVDAAPGERRHVVQRRRPAT